MRALLVLLAIGSLSVGVLACGSAGKDGSSASTPSSKVGQGYLKGDEDLPGDDISTYDDDRGVRGYGHEASAADRQAIAAIVKRYYAAAAANNAVGACTLIYSSLAKSTSLASAVPKEYAPNPESPLFRDKGCAQVETLLFKVGHNKLAEENASLQITAVRVDGDRGLALLGFRTTGERQIPVKREAGAWKIDALIDSELP